MGFIWRFYKYLIWVLVALSFYYNIIPHTNLRLTIGESNLDIRINEESNTTDFINIDNTKQKPEPFIPKNIAIPIIGLNNTQILPVKTVDNMLEAPLDFNKVGWSDSSSLAGSTGTVILDGHYDSTRGKAVFYRLKDLKLEDKILLYSEKKEIIVYRVVHIESYDRFKPTDEKIFKDDGRSRLNLITCNGTYDKQLGSYDRRLVIYCLIV